MIRLGANDGLFMLPILGSSAASVSAVSVQPSFETLHRRLGHCSEDLVTRLYGLYLVLTTWHRVSVDLICVQ